MRGPGSLGLIGILVIVGALYYFDLGPVLLARMQSFNNQCRSIIPTVGRAVGEPICGGVNYAVNGISQLAQAAGQSLQSLKQPFGSGPGMPSLQGATLASLRNDVASLSSSSDVLGRMLLAGPQSIGGGSAAQQFQQAIDGYSIGQRYLTQNNNPSMALPWLTRSAEQPQGYGLLSQLSLADLYRSGGTGVAADPQRSLQYYQQAASSLTQLSQTSNPQSQQLLQTLPASPQVIQQQLNQVIMQLKGGSKR